MLLLAILAALAIACMAMLVAVLHLACDRAAWRDKAEAAQDALCEARRELWREAYTPDGYLRSAESNALWVALASDRRGLNWTYGQESEGN